MDYQNAMAVDRHNLDEEAIQLPGWFGQVVEYEAAAADELAALTDKMKILQADINLMIRGWTVPQINTFFGLALTKLTEGTYASLVIIHPEVIKLQNNIIKARHRKTLYAAAVRSMEKKGDMLKELAKLYAQGYYMRIEGQEYKLPKMDLMIKQLETQIIERAKKENAEIPPVEKAHSDLKDRINSQSKDKGEQCAEPKARPKKSQKVPKTPKQSPPAVPKRVKG